jgi:hypothetical protein
MPVICSGLATLAVASIYYAWRAYDQARQEQERSLHERVAYMLWVMAQQAE